MHKMTESILVQLKDRQNLSTTSCAKIGPKNLSVNSRAKRESKTRHTITLSVFSYYYLIMITYKCVYNYFPGGDISRQRVTGFSHSLQGFRAVLTKRFLHHVRDFRFYLSQFILPCVFVILSMAFIKARPALGDYPAMLLTPDLYKSSFIRSVMITLYPLSS